MTSIAPVGEDAPHVAGEPATGDVRHPVRPDRLQHGDDRRAVHHRRRQEDLGHACTRSAGHGAVEVHALHQPAHQREAVGPQVGRLDPDHDVAGGDVRPGHLLAVLDHSHRGPGEIELLGRHHAGMLGGLAAEEGHPGIGAGGGDRPHQHLDDVGIGGADGQVVGHRQGTGPGGDQIVDAHRHQVVAEPVESPGAAGQVGLGAHPVGGHHHHRGPVTPGKADPGGEAPESAHHIVAPGGGDPGPDALDHGVGGSQVDPGLPVGRHHTRSSTNLSPADRISVGYSPDRHAVQNPSAPVASINEASSR